MRPETIGAPIAVTCRLLLSLGDRINSLVAVARLRNLQGQNSSRIRSLVPVTVAQLTSVQLSAAQDAWVLPYKLHDGTDFELNQVRIMGRLTDFVTEEVSSCESRSQLSASNPARSAELLSQRQPITLLPISVSPSCPQQTRSSMTISDSTGLVSIKVYHMDDDVGWAVLAPTLMVGSLVDVVLMLKVTGGSENPALLLNYVSAKLVTDANRYTQHLLECMYYYAAITKGPLPPINTAPGASLSSAGHAMGSGAFGGAAGGYGAGRAGAGAAGSWGGAGSSSSPGQTLAAAPSGRFADANVDAVLKAYEALNEAAGDEGTHVRAVHSWLGRNGVRMDEHTVRTSIEHLVMEGFLYSTIDEEHHKATH